MKRNHPDDPQCEYDVADIKPSPCATVHGVCVSLSPQKVSKRDCPYFEGQLSDGKKTIRVVSFEPKLRSKFIESKDEKIPMAINKCVVKETRTSSVMNTAYEVLVSSRSNIGLSPKKFSLTDACPDSNSTVFTSLNDLSSIALYQQVTVTGKITAIEPKSKVTSRDNKDLMKQDCIIANSETNCRLVLWQDSVDILKIGKTYELTGVTLRSFDGVKYLSGSEGASYREIEDMGEVLTTVNLLDGQSTSKVLCGEVIMVTSIEKYSSCITRLKKSPLTQQNVKGVEELLSCPNVSKAPLYVSFSRLTTTCTI